MKIIERNRIVYSIFIVLAILLGLGSRHYSNLLPNWIGYYAGDTLWALMAFLGLGLLFKSWSTLKIGIAALLFSFAIEISQLYHAPWIDNIRKTSLGSLVLGYGFLWSDLVCYFVGVMIGIFAERLIAAVKA